MVERYPSSMMSQEMRAVRKRASGMWRKQQHMESNFKDSG